MRKTLVVWFVVLTMVLGWGSSPAQTQEESEKNKSAKSTAEQSTGKEERGEKPIRSYRLDFSVNELDDGKKVNSRHYSMDVDVGNGHEIKIGTRVPVPIATHENDNHAVSPLINTQFQYMDIDTHIWCSLKEHGDEVELSVGSEMSRIGTAPGYENKSQPIIRHMKIDGSTVLTAGKPIVIGSVDDPNSTHQYQLEVTATKLH